MNFVCMHVWVSHRLDHMGKAFWQRLQAAVAVAVWAGRRAVNCVSNVAFYAKYIKYQRHWSKRQTIYQPNAAYVFWLSKGPTTAWLWHSFNDHSHCVCERVRDSFVDAWATPWLWVFDKRSQQKLTRYLATLSYRGTAVPWHCVWAQGHKTQHRVVVLFAL